MVVKILYYFLCFFFIVIFMLMSQDPYSLDLSMENAQKPTVEFIDVKDYRLGQNGTEIEARSSRVQRFDDRDVLHDVDALLIDANGVTSLRADNATMKDDIVYLKGEVRYINNSTIITTDAVEYHQNSSRLIGTAPFLLQNRGVEARGSSFVYNTKTERLNARGINATIDTERK